MAIELHPCIAVHRLVGQLSATFEIDNLSDEPLFDVWGVQRPGRSFNIKLSGQI